MMQSPAPILTPAEEKSWATACHLASLAGMVCPFGNLIGPLVIWLTKKNGSALVDRAGKESLNFQISMTVYIMVLAPLVFLFGLAFGVFSTFTELASKSSTTPPVVSVGAIELIVAAIAAFVLLGLISLICPIVAAVKTSDGAEFRYPLAIRLIR
jgi:uncharacterized Tic20 family protein